MKKHRHETGTVIVDGLRILSQLAEAGVEPSELYLSGDDIPLFPRVTRYRVTSGEMGRLTDTEQPQALAGLFVTRPPAFRDTTAMLYLDRVADPGNLGTILRTASAAGVAVLLSPECCDPFNPKAIRASLGASFYHPWRYCPESELLALDTPLVAADMTGAPLWDYHPPRQFVCVIGSEAHGLSDTLRNAATRVTIPLSGKMESLNAAVAAGIMLFTLQAASLR